MELLRYSIKSFILSGLSYIKPGCMHRYSQDPELVEYTSLGTSIFESLRKSMDLGGKVASGKLSAPDIKLGLLLSETLKELGGKYSQNITFYDSVVIAPIILLSTAHAIQYRKGSNINEGHVGNSLRLFLTSSGGKDSATFIQITKLMGPLKYVELIDKAGFTKTRVELENISLYEIFFTLSTISITFKALVDFSIMLSLVGILKEAYTKYGNVNNAIVISYISLLLEIAKLEAQIKEELNKAIKLGVMTNREAIKTLFEIDRKLKREKRNYNHLLPILTTVVFLGLTFKHIA